jgi:hypothetical protein
LQSGDLGYSCSVSLACYLEVYLVTFSYQLNGYPKTFFGSNLA